MSTATMINNKPTKATPNRRRFSDDQIRSLETMFETEARPELRLKQHLANKLGLHPRQVAIWFQNKRARSKSKQIEGQYSVLKSSYDELASRFQALREENQNLMFQLQRLRKMADNREGEETKIKNNCSDSYRFTVEMNGHDQPFDAPAYCGMSRKEYLGEGEADVFDMVRMAEGSLASPENGCSFESETFLNHTVGGSQLWDF